MRVGTRHFAVGLWTHTQDHPHACGDKLSFLSSSGTYTGSSPCVWGQVEQSKYYTTQARIIPMRVGTSAQGCRLNLNRWDHPHACGDKLTDFYKKAKSLGSSPCVWGQVNRDDISASNIRIIPMRVGTSISHHFMIRTGKDHPHACGDK